MQSSIVSLVLLLTLAAVYAEPQYGGHPGRFPGGYPYGYPFGYPTGYRTPYIPRFREYPTVAQRPEQTPSNGRIFFLESTVFVTTTTTSSITCTYSSAALAACAGRKRRGILFDGDEEFIAPTQVIGYFPLLLIGQSRLVII